MTETKSEQIYRELKEHKDNTGRSRKKKVSRIIMIFDAIVILIILIIMSTRNPETMYSSADLVFSGTKIRFSISESRETKNYIFTLTFKGMKERVLKKGLKNGLGTVELQDGEKTFFRSDIGKGLADLSLGKDEIRVFSTEVEKAYLNDYLAETGRVINKKHSILDMKGQFYKFRARVTINFKEPISIPLEFRHEVKI